MATGYLQSLLGEDEYEKARSGAMNNALLMAGLQGLLASGPSYAPVGFGQVAGQAGIAGMQGYNEALQQAEQSGLRSREFRQQEEAQARQNAFNQALQGVYTPSGQINYPAMQRLIMEFPDLASPAVQAIKSGVKPVVAAPKPESFTLKPGEQRFVMGADGKPILVASAGQQEDFKLDQPTLMMMQNVYGTTDFAKLSPDQQLVVNQFRNAPDAAKQAELAQAANELRFNTGIVVPVPKSRDEILIDLIRGGQPTEQTAVGTQPSASPAPTVEQPSPQPVGGATTGEGGFPKAPTELQKQIDARFAQDYVDWVSGGGSDVMSQLGQIKTVAEALERGEPLTGISVAVQPDILLAMTNPNALQSRELVESVVQRNLRIILGAQFTQAEGERLISRAYNPKLRPEENAARIRNLFLQMSTAAQQKQAMVDYVQKNGTLVGYKGRMPTIDDFYTAITSAAPSTPAGAKPLTDIFK